MDINWDEAPYDAIGLAHVGLLNLPVWVGEDWYEYVYARGERFSFGSISNNTAGWPKEALINFVTRPETWDGEGLPPVGSKVEFYSDDFENEDYWNKDLTNGCEVEIIAHITSSASQSEADLAVFVFQYSHGNRQVEQAVSCCFRPIKTKEQFAAEEREKAIEEMVALVAKGQDYSVQAETGTSTADYVRNACEQLHDAGYRKQEND